MDILQIQNKIRNMDNIWIAAWNELGMMDVLQPANKIKKMDI